MPLSNVAKRGWSLLFLGIAAFYLYGLGTLPLVDPDEPRYAEVAREMLARHDLITPTLGGLPWFEKPPLLYWMMIASYRVFGVNEFAARLGPALCGLLTAGFTYWVAATAGHCESTFVPRKKTGRLEPKSLPRWSALVLLSSVGIIALSRAASFDIVVTMTLTGALASFFVWELRSARIVAPVAATAKISRLESVPLFSFYLFVGLSLLAKGLIGILIPLGVIGLYFVLRRERPQRRFLQSLLWGLPLAFATAAVWYAPMVARHGGKFVDQFIVQHHFARFLTNKYHHPQPFYFYLITLSWLVLPWTILLVAAFISARSWKWRGDAPVDRLRVFALAWIIVPIVFFSLSESKLAAYALPVVPAAALLIAERITCFLRAEAESRVIRLTGLILIGLAGAGAWYSVSGLGTSPWCAASMVSASLIIGVTALLFPSKRKALFLLFSLTALTASATALHCAAPGAARRVSVRDLLTAATARGYGRSPVVQLHTVERTAEFYASDRLLYRPDGEPLMLEDTVYVADAARKNDGPVLCFVPLKYEYDLQTYASLQTEEIGNNGRVALVVVRVK